MAWIIKNYGDGDLSQTFSSWHIYSIQDPLPENRDSKRRATECINPSFGHNSLRPGD